MSDGPSPASIDGLDTQLVGIVQALDDLRRGAEPTEQLSCALELTDLCLGVYDKIRAVHNGTFRRFSLGKYAVSTSGALSAWQEWRHDGYRLEGAIEDRWYTTWIADGIDATLGELANGVLTLPRLRKVSRKMCEIRDLARKLVRQEGRLSSADQRAIQRLICQAVGVATIIVLLAHVPAHGIILKKVLFYCLDRLLDGSLNVKAMQPPAGIQPEPANNGYLELRLDPRTEQVMLRADLKLKEIRRDLDGKG
jgi:hypothetical protein